MVNQKCMLKSSKLHFSNNDEMEDYISKELSKYKNSKIREIRVIYENDDILVRLKNEECMLL